MDLQIREARRMDAYEFAAVHVQSWQAAYRNIIPDSYSSGLNIEKRAERFAEYFITFKDKTFYYIAELDEKAIGVLMLGKCRDEDKPDSGEIFAIYLLPEYWGRGYGKDLMDFGINKLRELGFSDYCLWVLRDNHRARCFYEKHGFIYDGTEKEIHLGKPLVEIRYQKI